MSHPVSQAAGLFVPQTLLLAARLKPMERNAWMVFRSKADSNGIATVNYESLRVALLSAPGSPDKNGLRRTMTILPQSNVQVPGQTAGHPIAPLLARMI
jgi:hypothetical protein